MTDEQKIVSNYKGHTITIGPINMRFLVDGPFLERQWFSSYLDATNKIDHVTKSHEAQTRRRIAVHVLTKEGQPTTITGIHAGTGRLLGLNAFSSQRFYPNVAWIADTLAQIEKLNAEAAALSAKIEPYQLSRPYDNKRTHSEQIDHLLKTIEDTAARAVKEGPT